jgi:hypothetical protein
LGVAQPLRIPEDLDRGVDLRGGVGASLGQRSVDSHAAETQPED